MASILLKKDHNGAKAGAVISAPFSQSQGLIAQGVGVLHQPAPAKSTAAPVIDAAALQNRINDLSAQVKFRDKRLAETEAALDESKAKLAAKEAELATAKTELVAVKAELVQAETKLSNPTPDASKKK